jgi:hypothetical protein
VTSWTEEPLFDDQDMATLRAWVPSTVAADRAEQELIDELRAAGAEVAKVTRAAQGLPEQLTIEQSTERDMT